MDRLADPNVWAAFAALFSLEVVLGIDNIVFIAILANRLPPDRAPRARLAGLSIALITRLLLLYSIEWLEHLTDPVVTVAGHAVSWRDIVLISGGLFLMAKATKEIHTGMEGTEHGPDGAARKAVSFGAIVGQIVLIDIVFSLDSVITAVGMADDIVVMIAAIVGAMAIMLVASGPIAGFIDRNPTFKMLALSFLMLVGVSLVADGTGLHVPRGYIYAAMGFSLGVEVLNTIAARNRRRKS